MSWRYAPCKHAKPLQLLKKRNFRNAHLFGSTLCGTDLEDAKLHGALLWGAELHGTSLTGAELRGATLWRAELHGATLEGAELHLADLRWIDLSSKLNEEKFRKMNQKIEKIRIPVRRVRALKRIERIENGKTSIEPQSLKDSVLCDGDDLHTRLKGSKLLDEMFVVNCQPGNETQLSPYYEKLSDYLIDLVCSDDSGHVAERIADRFVPSRERDLPSWQKVLSVVEKKMNNTLDESDCKTEEEKVDDAEA